MGGLEALLGGLEALLGGLEALLGGLEALLGGLEALLGGLEAKFPPVVKHNAVTILHHTFCSVCRMYQPMRIAF